MAMSMMAPAYGGPAPGTFVAPQASMYLPTAGAYPMQATSRSAQMPMPMPAPSVVVPGPPPGVDPRQASEQFGLALEAQLKKQSDAIIEEARLKKQMLEEQAKRDLAQFQLQVDEEKSMQMLQVDKEAMAMIAGLQETAITRKTVMEEESAIAIAGYSKAKAMEEMAAKSYQVQKQFHEAEKKMKAEYDKVMRAGAGSLIGAGGFPPAYAMPPPAYHTVPAPGSIV
jgi:hypothetical protein